MANQKSKRAQELRRACERMPELVHYVGKGEGAEYDVIKSELVAWLVKQPVVLEFLWQKVRESGAIVYNSETNTWQGLVPEIMVEPPTKRATNTWRGSGVGEGVVSGEPTKVTEIVEGETG